MEFLQNIYYNIKLFFYLLYLRLSIALSNFEKGMKMESMNKDSGSGGMEIKNIQREYINALQRGEISKEQKDYFYKILRGADKFMENKNKMEMLASAQSLGLGAENEELIEYLNSDLKSLADNKTGYIDNEYHYPVEHIIPNHIRYPYDWDSEVENKDLGVTVIKYDKKDLWLEDIIFKTTVLHVKKVDEVNSILEFYVPEDYTQLMYVPLTLPATIGFTDKYGDMFEYTITNTIKGKKDGRYSMILIFEATKVV